MKVVGKITPPELLLEVRDSIAARGNVALFTGWGPKLAAVTVLVLWVFLSWLFLHLLGINESFL